MSSPPTTDDQASSRVPGVMLLMLLAAAGRLAGAAEDLPGVGQRLARRGDEIMVCGQLYHTTTPVVLWCDPGGYDAYRPEPRLAPPDPPGPAAGKQASPSRFASVSAARG